MIGLGTQDDFAYAQRFVEEAGLSVPEMLWDPSFSTWRTFGVTANSQMMVLAPDLESGTSLIYGFDDGQQSAIVELAAELGREP